ncbi:hypothetical protein ACFL20_12185 [Spirochaetota bacterium]
MKMRIIITLLISFSIIIAGCNNDQFKRYKEDRFIDPNPPSLDKLAPFLIKAEAISRDSVIVNFSERLDGDSAQQVANFFIQGQNRVEIDSATYNDTNRTVTLTINITNTNYAMITGRNYTLLVQNVSDIHDNKISYAVTNFEGVGPVMAVLDDLTLPQGNSTSINVTVSGADVVSYQYSIDGSVWGIETDIAVPISLTGLSEGAHTLKIIGKETGGKWQEINNASVFSWTVDLSPPTAQLLGVPESITQTTSADITVGGLDVVSYKYSLNGSPYTDEIPINIAERSGRAQDKDDGGGLETLRRDGYM